MASLPSLPFRASDTSGTGSGLLLIPPRLAGLPWRPVVDVGLCRCDVQATCDALRMRLDLLEIMQRGSGQVPRHTVGMIPRGGSLVVLCPVALILRCLGFCPRVGKKG